MSKIDAAGVMPVCSNSGGGVVVVGTGENLVQGEGLQELGRNCKLGDDTPTQERRIWVSELQQRLAQKALEQPKHRFGDLYDLLTWDSVLQEAATRLLGNKGSRTPGLDGIGLKALQEKEQDYHIAILKEQLKEGTFQPNPVKRTYIPKKNGKMRPLGIPTIYDRWIQMAIKIILEPIFESDFAPYSHGFRPSRSCLTAVAQIHSYTQIRKRKYYWVIEGDIEGFFDHVHHKKLMSLLRERIRDKKLLDLIWQFLRAGVMEGSLFKQTSEGTPQGGVLSPLLANIYLNHFDQWFAKRAMLGYPHGRNKNRRAGKANFVMVRYADDFVIFSNGSKEQTVMFKEEIQAWLANELKLTLSVEKTAITHFTDGFNFLGFTFKKTIAQRGKNREVVVHYPSTDSVQRAVQRVRELTDRRHVGKSHEEQIEALNMFLRGWGEYFRHSSAKKAMSYVSSRAHMRMWSWLMCKDKGNTRRGWREIKTKYYNRKEYTWQAGKQKLLIVPTMKVDYPRIKPIEHPYLKGQTVKEPKLVNPYSPKWDGHNKIGEDWKPAREKVLEDYEYKCAICGTTENIEVHHIKPRRNGGSNEKDNLIPLCATHHDEAERRNSAVSHQIKLCKK